MKKLKLQKALLAICLALPITLTMSNEIKATGNANNQLPINNGNKPQDEQPPINQQRAVRHTLTNYTQNHQLNTTLNPEQTQDYLKGHISNDIDTYLTTRILANFNLLTATRDTNNNYYLDDDTVYKQLDNNPTAVIQPNQTGEAETKALVAAFQDNINRAQLNKRANTPTPEDEIILLLFTRIWKVNPYTDIDTTLNTLQQLVNQYKDNKDKQGDTKYTELAKHFDAIVALLELERKSETTNPLNKRITTTQTIVKEFSKEYKAKTQEQPLNGNNSNPNNKQTNTKKTLKQLVEGFKQENNLVALTEEKHNKDFLKYCIQDGTIQYLAMMLSAKFKIIPRTSVKLNDNNFWDIYPEELIDLLYKDPLNEAENPGIINENQTQNDISELIKILKNQKTQAEQTTSFEVDLITLLFKPQHGKGNTPDTIEMMENLCNTYTKHPNIKKDTSCQPIIDKFRPLANQLTQYKSKENEPYITTFIDRLITILEKFYDAYGQKQPANQQELNTQAKLQTYKINIQPLEHKEEEKEKEPPVNSSQILSSQANNNEEESGNEQIEENQPEQQNYNNNIQLQMPNQEELIPTELLKFFQSENENRDPDTVEDTLKLIANKEPNLLKQLAYANLLHYGITIYKDQDDNDKFNNYLDTIIKTGELTIGSETIDIKHPLVFEQPSAETSDKLVTQSKEAIKNLNEILNIIAKTINENTGIASQCLTELQPKAQKLHTELDEDTKQQIAIKGYETLAILNEAYEDLDTTSHTNKQTSPKCTTIRSKLIVLRAILDIITEQKDNSQDTSIIKGLQSTINAITANPQSNPNNRHKQSPHNELNQQQIAEIYTALHDMKGQIDTKADRDLTYATLNINTTGADLASARIDKLTTEIQQLKQQQTYQTKVTNNLLKINQILLQIVMQLNTKQLISQLPDDITQPFKEILKAKKQFKTESQGLTQLLKDNEQTIDVLQKNYDKDKQTMYLINAQLQNQNGDYEEGGGEEEQYYDNEEGEEEEQYYDNEEGE